MQTKNQEIDYIVVGSGPGGATAAKELAQRKKKVLVLEWGDNDPLTGSFWYGLKSLLWPGNCLLFTGQLLGLVRGITTRVPAWPLRRSLRSKMERQNVHRRSAEQKYTLHEKAPSNS